VFPTSATSSSTSALTRSGYEHETLYPSFALTAREEGFDLVADWFETLADASGRHRERLERERKILDPRLSPDE